MKCIVTSAAKDGDLLIMEKPKYGPIYCFLLSLGAGKGRLLVELGCKDQSLSKQMPCLTFPSSQNSACLTFEHPPIFELMFKQEALLNSDIEVIPYLQRESYAPAIIIQNDEAFLYCERSSLLKSPQHNSIPDTIRLSSSGPVLQQINSMNSVTAICRTWRVGIKCSDLTVDGLGATLQNDFPINWLITYENQLR